MLQSGEGHTIHMNFKFTIDWQSKIARAACYTSAYYRQDFTKSSSDDPSLIINLCCTTFNPVNIIISFNTSKLS